ncbi:hypothetical protein EVA_14472 [gut metagenome]|uniref:Uncharacterized protein n=1 Tax=gut metagenome TaxID=749906 RepID=J9GDH6_9ZZZZ
MTEQTFVLSGDFITGCTVYKDGIEDVHLLNLTHHAFDAALSTLLHGLTVMMWVNAIAVVDGM